MIALIQIAQADAGASPASGAVLKEPVDATVTEPSSQ